MFNKILEYVTKSKSTVVINGQSFEGQGDVCVSANGKVTIGDKVYGFDSNVKNIKVDVVVHGHVINLHTTSGNVDCEYAENIETTSGDVNVKGDVYNNVKTVSGDVCTRSVGGNVKTVSGDIGL